MADLLDFTKPHVLRNESEYNAAIEEIDTLLDEDPPPATEDYERLEFLSVLVESYENIYFPIAVLPTPQDAVDFMLEQKGLSRIDLDKWMGGKSRTSEFFNDIRRLSIRQIEILRKNLGIPADLLIGDPKVKPNF
ncbi:MAG: transcriptional regulator [Candidatus Latescibacteria bacterium]|nr:transcriptional regulator [Candidatus Latescibacterota bacterium]